jgi:hypothetical protein
MLIYIESIWDNIVGLYQKAFGVTVSREFISCMEDQLKKDFLRQTGIAVNQRVSLAFSFPPGARLQKGAVSSFTQNLYINNHWVPVQIAWSSKSGRVYSMEDTDVDCNDIGFHWEGLDPLRTHKQMVPGETLPFKLKDLSYNLVVTRLNMETILEMTLKEGGEKEKIIGLVNDFLHDYNAKSMKKDRADGIVHNWRTESSGDKLVFTIDTGSAGPQVLKKLLPYLSKIGAFEQVELV